MPVSINKVADLSNLWDEMVKLSNKAVLRILVDHPDQLDALEAFEKQRREPRQWSLFVKVDAGYKYVHQTSLGCCDSNTFIGVQDWFLAARTSRTS